MHRLASLSIGARLVIAIIVVVLAVLWIAARGIWAVEAMMMDEKRVATRQLVETAHGIVAHFGALAEAKTMSAEDARTAAVAVVKSLRYSEREYFWINDMHPRMVMHPIRPELDGKDLSDNKDPSGKRLFVEFVDTVRKSKAGFVDYLWPKPGATEPVPKVSYVKGYEPWGWVIGSGIYVDDVQAAVGRRIRVQGAAILGLMAFFVVAGWFLRRSIVRPLATSVGLAHAIAGGKLDNEIRTEGPQESRRMLEALANMQKDLRERIEADRVRLNENERIRQALDASSVPVRIVNNEGTILFMNRTLRKKLDELEPEIKKRIPAFDRAKLLGGSIGIFYPNPSEALERLRTITSERRSVLEIGGRHFDIVTNPIVNDAGERLGTVGEWVDRHDELRAEKRLAELIEAAGRGDFSGRVELDGLAGFHLSAAKGINRLMDEVSTSLAALADVLDGLSQGELHQRMTGQYQGLFAKLQGDMNGTVEKLATTVGEIRQAAESVSVAAREIAQGNTDLSSRTEQQASSLEETASSMEELTSTVKQTADHAREARRLATDASTLAAEGGSTVTRVVSTMAEIGESSRRVQEIIAVIDGIAFQTNILALNAAVEAARAGEQGKGFAVVATEVRTLAQRSAAAAREIRELISSAADRVEAGSTLVQAAGEQMSNIVGAVKRVTDIIGEIASAAAEQSTGIDQVNSAVTQMDQMTQQNAALVEQAAAAAESLQEQAANLTTAIGAFKLAAQTGSARRPLARAA